MPRVTTGTRPCQVFSTDMSAVTLDTQCTHYGQASQKVVDSALIVAHIGKNSSVFRLIHRQLFNCEAMLRPD